MSDILFPISGGPGNLDEITASAEYVKSPYTFMNSEGDIEEGTMVDRENWGATVGMNDHVTVPEGYHDGSGEVYGPTVTQRGAWTSRLGINGKVMIPEGYHDGNGYVDQSIDTMAKQTIIPDKIAKTVKTAGKYLTGDIIVAKIPNQKGASTKAISSGVNSQGLYYYIPEGYYLPDNTGNCWVYRTLAEVASSLGLTAAKIKKNEKVCGITGTFEGWIKNSPNYLLSGKDFSNVSSASSGIEYGNGFVGTHGGSYVIFNKTYDLRRYSKVRFYAAYNEGTGDGKHYVKISAKHPASGVWLVMFTINTPSSPNTGAWLESAINVFFPDTCQLRLDFYNCLINDVHLE